jgi:hypothetical protein
MVPIKNIQSQASDSFTWDSAAPSASLDLVFNYVVGQANRSESWYWQHKTVKARYSQLIQWTAVMLTGLAALLPITAQLGLFPGFAAWLKSSGLVGQVNSGLMTSFFIGLAGALIGFDRVSGLSSGWTRYVLTGTAIRSACEEFRMDWTVLTAQLGSPPQPERILAMIQRAKVFRMAIEALVLKETQDWATEFQNNMAQMEKDLKVQIDQAKADKAKAEEELKARVEEQKAALEKASQTGSVEAIVTNADVTDGFLFNAKLETNQAVLAEEAVPNSQSWARIDVPAGQYKLTISARVKTKPVSGMIVVSVKPGETTKTELALPAAPPA